MTSEFEITNLSEVLRWLGKSEQDIENAGAFALGQVALAVEAQAKRNFDGTHRRVGSSWQPSEHVPSKSIDGFEVPNVRTGNLRRSIRTDVVPKGLGKYEATVQPGMIYSRRVEVEYGYRFMRPARDEVARQANQIFTTAFRRKMGF